MVIIDQTIIRSVQQIYVKMPSFNNEYSYVCCLCIRVCTYTLIFVHINYVTVITCFVFKNSTKKGQVYMYQLEGMTSFWLASMNANTVLLVSYLFSIFIVYPMPSVYSDTGSKLFTP